MADFDQTLAESLLEATAAGLRRELRPLAGRPGREIQLGGSTLLNFAANDYLGLAGHPEVVEASVRASRDHGASSSASRLLSGSLEIHHRLEDALADWKGTEAALTFASGYATALGVIPALVGREDMVVLDRRVHACCVDAARLSGATLRVFRHNDLEHLEALLRWADDRRGPRREQRILIVTESVFSMDGDQSPLAGIVGLKEQFGAWLLLDEAHAAGLLGPNRSGLASATGLGSRIEVQMGTLGKALASAGGYIAGSRILVDFLVNHARSFIFSTAPVPAAPAAAHAALKIVQSDEGSLRCERVWANARRTAAVTQPAHPPTSVILPVILGAEEAALQAAASLRERGLWVPAIRYPTVSRGKARLRITLSAAHTDEDMNQLLAGLRELARPLS